MIDTFNLTTEKWIPCIGVSGEKQELSLIEFFENISSICCFDGTPTIKVALLHFILTISHTALKPKTSQEIEGYLSDSDFVIKKCLDYLKEKSDRFDLYSNEKPFLQVACLDVEELDIENDVVVGKLLGNRECISLMEEGEGTVQIRSDMPQKTLSSSQEALWLVISQIYGANIKYGRDKGKGPILKSSVNDSIYRVNDVQTTPSEMVCTSASSGGGTEIIHIHSSLNLYYTLIFNMVSSSDIVSYPKGWGHPIWEVNTHDYQLLKAEMDDVCGSFLGRLTPLSKFIKIIPNQGRMQYAASEGIDYKKYGFAMKLESSNYPYYINASPDPTVKACLKRYNPSINFWREFETILSIRGTCSVFNKFSEARWRDEFLDQAITVEATSVEITFSTGLYYILRDISSSIFSTISGISDLLCRTKDVYVDNLNIAQNNFKKLDDALMSFAAVMGLSKRKGLRNEPWYRYRLNSYWMALDRKAQWMVNNLQSDSIRDDWGKCTLNIARESILSMKNRDIRTMKAITIALKKLQW